MKKTLEKLYDSLYQPKDYSSLEQQIEENHKRLIHALKKKHRKLVLLIIDNKDLIKHLISFDSFVQGVRLGLSLKDELDRYDDFSSDGDDWE